MTLTEERAQVVREVLLHVPVGTEVVQARAVMERNGFSCAEMTDQPFLEKQHINYLYCDRRSFGIPYTRWQVALIKAGERVSDVDAGVGTTGP